MQNSKSKPNKFGESKEPLIHQKAYTLSYDVQLPISAFRKYNWN